VRKAFAKSVLDLAAQDDKVVVLIGDISHFLLREFEEQYPDRFYNVGICEQAIVGMAAGLAMEGYRPIVHTIAPFCVERAYEQIKVDLCYQNLDVTIISVGASLDYAHLGCTHHCYEDVSILRPLPNIDIFVPGSSSEYKKLLEDSWANGRPKYFKLNKTQHKQKFEVAAYECNVLSHGLRGAIFVNGHLLQEVCEVPHYRDYTIVYCPTVEPISEASKQIMGGIMKNHNNVLVVEENSSSGAFADKVADVAFEQNLRVRIKKLGIPRSFCLDYGSAAEHRIALGFTSKNIEQALGEFVHV
jgi:transketolase